MARRLSLQVRLVLVLLVLSLVPLAVSALLIEQIAEVAQNFASNHAAELRPPLEQADNRFAELIDAKKELFRAITDRVASDPSLEASEGEAPSERKLLDARLAEHLESSADLLALAVLDSTTGAEFGSASRASPTRAGLTNYRVVEVDRPIAGSTRLVRARFAADLTIMEELGDVHDAIKLSKQVDRVRSSLPSRYVVAFLALVGGVVVVVTLFGIVVARRLSRRIETLLDATRRLAGGDLEARATVPGRDELAELASAFNAMVDELRSDREQILYLQRIGAWQDVARRLAHEIKNPLTPIQLAMQQVVSSYDGDDERFGKLLADADEIVGEEITSLRRLVDAFSALGRLPRPDAKPLDVAVVLDDLKKDPVFADKLVVIAPEHPVMVGGDRLLLRRLLANLIDNGIEASDDAVQVTWSADESRRVAVITVEDSGPGIEPGQSAKLFEPYVTSKDTGTGLGLAISKKIAIEHRGSLDVDLEPGSLGGATMRLTIPLVDS